MPKPTKRYQLRVIYKRAGWKQTKAKTYPTEAQAVRMALLLVESQFQYGKLDSVRIDKREIGPWVSVRKFHPEAFRGAWTDRALREVEGRRS